MRWAARLLRSVAPSRPAVRRSARLAIRSLEDRAVPSATVGQPENPTPVDVPVVKADPPADGAPVILSSMADGPKPHVPQPPFPQIGDRLWRDLNGNGLQDPGEPGLPFVTLRLYQGNQLVGITQSDGLGHYAFNVWNVTNGTADTSDDGLKAGTAYQIRIAGDQSALVGLRPTTANVGTDELRDSDAIATPAGATLDFTMGVDEIYYHYDIGYIPAATIGDLVWSDANNNGVKDKAEAGLAGVAVRLLDAAGQVELAATTTGADGSYVFTGLAPGTYVVEIAKGNFSAGSPLFGCASSTGAAGQATGPYEGSGTPDATGGDGKDHGTTIDGAVRCKPVTVSAGNLDNRSVDFGFFRSGTLSGRVYVDLNANGRSDYEDMTGLVGVKVTIGGPAGTFIATTDATGGYSFSNLPAGTYTVTETQPGGYRSSTSNLVTTVVGPTAPATVDFGEARAADLSVKLTARPAAVGVGGILTLTYRVKNVGTLDATGVTLMAPLPNGMTFVGVDQTGGTYDQAGQRAMISTLVPGAEATIVVRVRAVRAGWFRLMATVQGTKAEDRMSDNRSMASVSVGGVTAPGSAAPVSLKSIMLSSAFRR